MPPARHGAGAPGHDALLWAEVYQARLWVSPARPERRRLEPWRCKDLPAQLHRQAIAKRPSKKCGARPVQRRARPNAGKAALQAALPDRSRATRSPASPPRWRCRLSAWGDKVVGEVADPKPGAPVLWHRLRPTRQGARLRARCGPASTAGSPDCIDFEQDAVRCPPGCLAWSRWAAAAQFATAHCRSPCCCPTTTRGGLRHAAGRWAVLPLAARLFDAATDAAGSV